MENELKPFWRKFFDFNWKFGLFLILIICVPRFILVLNANETSNYRYIGVIMTVSAIAPFIFLNKHGKKTIGLAKSKNYSWLVWSFVFGLIFSVVLYFLGDLIYNDTFQNWYVYIGNSYNIPTEIEPNDKLIMFVIMAIVGMTFSPIGEELFFRGIVHSCFAKSLGDKKASIIDSSAFALTHISHFGLVFINNEWDFLITPTIIWVLGMFLVSILFYKCREKSGSLTGAIICHSAFNLGMIYCIFYLLN
ncbi:type II CAAX endopeptidase family protein [Algoriphagus sp. C2-6-M1]|uniref:CPBP family intramembrane glutamic endopeptidase n=1 Tax=Algoriphagus persicinus TaxID=3108754 RepID=UPI002B3EE052|nr:type II CAAX endopeptidase family protein [Algoriphagus sp. C2-6-M1]MEB2779706.1 type II CAAX endopeptidase family protein [Algoriphagus sp. C2-6-M1]